MGWNRRVGLAALLVLAVAGGAGAACGGGDDDDGGSGGEAATTAPTTATPSTTEPRTWAGEAAGEHEVAPGYRQGLARLDEGWVFSTNDALYRTDDAFIEVGGAEGVIPDELAARGYDHVGDVDVADGVLWAPIEQPSREDGQVIARYDADTFAYVGSEEVDQHHAAFVAVDGDVVYSIDEFDGDDEIRRYRWTGEALDELDPLPMDRTLTRTQGGDVADGALWISTDDERNGVYRVDLATGAVSDLGSAGDVAGEGEGIDAGGAPSGPLRVLVADPALVPMWVFDVGVTSSPA
jgi:hypothetical protein